jgi:hypothetical protein
MWNLAILLNMEISEPDIGTFRTGDLEKHGFNPTEANRFIG